MLLKITVESMYFIRWWVDAFYNVHWDIRGHNDSMISLRKGDIIIDSNNQKINVKNSTEGELFDTHDQIPDVLHTLYFIEAQDYTIDINFIYQ